MSAETAARTPPGQHVTKGWPVLHSETIPPFDPATWRFRADGEVEAPAEWGWEDFRALPSVALTSDFHCVTGWSKLDNTWEGVRFSEVADRARPSAEATHALVEAPSGYTANLPLSALLDDDVLFAWAHNGEPLPPEHGGPLRLVVPKRYGWKSVKWAVRVRFLNRDVRGYWEERGYHNDADPWLEQRYSWQEGR
ncbi:MAG TPA: sulfite oxidase-like oxidoreductase [Actinomycetota bacterium]|nr:sulfite oxidase-like oxidoreductase [Actinomycetota bacterium]